MFYYAAYCGTLYKRVLLGIICILNGLACIEMNFLYMSLSHFIYSMQVHSLLTTSSNSPFSNSQPSQPHQLSLLDASILYCDNIMCTLCLTYYTVLFAKSVLKLQLWHDCGNILLILIMCISSSFPSHLYDLII